MTGRHAIRVGMTSQQDNFAVMGLGPGRLPEEELTLPEALQARGYSTYMIGARSAAHKH
jgi:arylsulfatase A-like enzyme